MKYIIVSLLAVLFLSVSCSDNTTDPEDNGTVKIVSSFHTGSTWDAISKSDEYNSGIDSVVVEGFDILVSRVMFHTDGANEESYVYKDGPYRIKADLVNEEYEVTTVDVPQVKYDKIKFEIHRFEASETSQWENDEDFGIFATPERYSVVVRGKIYEGGSAEDFTYNGTVTVNLTFNFDPYIDLEEDDYMIMDVEVDPNAIFVDKGSILDPRDGQISNKIDNNISEAFKMAIR